MDNNIREELAGIKNELEGSKKILGKCASALVSLLCEKNMTEDKEKIAVLEERISNWTERTETYRKEQALRRAEEHKEYIENFQIIFSKLDKLPCEKHVEKLNEIEKIRATMGRYIIYGITSLVGIAVVWGMVQQQVHINTLRLDKIELSEKPNAR